MAPSFKHAVTPLDLDWDSVLYYIHDAHDLLNLRATCRAFRDSKCVLRRCFSTIYIHSPPHGEQNISALPSLGPDCQDLIIRVAYPRCPSRATRHGRRRSGGDSLYKKNIQLHLRQIHEDHEHEHGHQPLAQCMHLGNTTSSYTPLRISTPRKLPVVHPPRYPDSEPPTQPAAYKFLVQRRPTQVDHSLLQKWHQTLSLFPNIATLTIAVNGDPNWPGCTDIEMLLIYLRISIERVNFRRLQTVRVAPLHAGGLAYLRWAGLGAFGEAPGKVWDTSGGEEVARSLRQRGCIWQRIQRLELFIRSPYIRGRLSDGQVTVFDAVLGDYLRSFRRSLKVLVFRWADGEGPNPLLLKREEDEALVAQWEVLEQVWLGNCVLRKDDLAALREQAKVLQQLMVMLPRAADSHGAAGHDHGNGSSEQTWQDILHTRCSSPADSQESAISSTSRFIPIKLDF